MTDREKRLRSQTASIQADADHDWRFFEDNVDELEIEASKTNNPVLRAAAGLVVIQIYLNKIARSFDEFNGNGTED